MTVIVIGIVAAVIMIVLIFVVITGYFKKEKTDLFKPVAEVYISGSSGSTTESFTQPNNMSILKSRNKEPFKPFNTGVVFDFTSLLALDLKLVTRIENNGKNIDGIKYYTVDAIKIEFHRAMNEDIDEDIDNYNTDKNIIIYTDNGKALPEEFTIIINNDGIRRSERRSQRVNSSFWS